MTYKKVIISLVVFFGFSTFLYADNQTFTTPTYQDIVGNSQDDGTVLLTDSISNGIDSRNSYCVSQGGTYVSHNSTTSSIGRAYINTSTNLWSFEDAGNGANASISILLDITCDLPVINPPGTGTGGIYFSTGITDLFSGIPPVSFDSSLIESYLGIYDFLDDDDFKTAYTGNINGIIQDGNGNISDLTLSYTGDGLNSQLKVLIKILYDIKFTLQLAFGFWLMFKTIQWLRRFFYFVR